MVKSIIDREVELELAELQIKYRSTSNRNQASKSNFSLKNSWIPWQLEYLDDNLKIKDGSEVKNDSKDLKVLVVFTLKLVSTVTACYNSTITVTIW